MRSLSLAINHNFLYVMKLSDVHDVRKCYVSPKSSWQSSPRNTIFSTKKIIIV